MIDFHVGRCPNIQLPKKLIVLNLLRHFNHRVYEKMIAFMVVTNFQFPLYQRL